MLVDLCPVMVWCTSDAYRKSDFQNDIDFCCIRLNIMFTNGSVESLICIIAMHPIEISYLFQYINCTDGSQLRFYIAFLGFVDGCT